MKDSEEDKPKLVLVSNSASNEKEPKKKDRSIPKQLAFVQGMNERKTNSDRELEESI